MIQTIPNSIIVPECVGTQISRIFPFMQHYAWGKGLGGRAAMFQGENLPDTNSHTSYAEAWFGSHAKGSAYIEYKSERFSLANAIEAYPDNILGLHGGANKKHMPILIKILSIGQPLSLQVHPTDAQAALLNNKNPNWYPDRSAKPETAIAIEPAELLYGFRSANEIKQNLETIPEFNLLLGAQALTELLKSFSDLSPERWIRSVCVKLLAARDNYKIIKSSCSSLCKRVKTIPQEARPRHEQWILETSRFHLNGDIGLFWFYILNLLDLPTGNSIHVAPGIPHSYLCGELLEIQKTSDNTVRCGLTPKPIDVDAFLEITNFTSPPTNVPSSIPFSITKIQPKTNTVVCTNKSFSVVVSTCGCGSISTVGKNQEHVVTITQNSVFLIPATLPNTEVFCKNGQVFAIEPL